MRLFTLLSTSGFLIFQVNACISALSSAKLFMDHVQNCPVTALALILDHVLVGQGNQLEIWHLPTSKLLVRQRVFKKQEIHGFRWLKQSESRVIILAWGHSLMNSVFLDFEKLEKYVFGSMRKFLCL